MSSETKVVYVQFRRVNVRREPRIEDGNTVDFYLFGDPLEILTHRAEETPDGWVWRRLAESDTHWVAEHNTRTGDRLLGESAPELDSDDSDEPQTLYVHAQGVKVRSAPRIEAGNEVGSHVQGKAVLVKPFEKQIGPGGWVWRQTLGEEAGWVAEYHSRTGRRLMSVLPLETPDQPEAPKPAVSEPGAIPAVLPGRVQTKGTRFLLDGQPCRFIGVNFREFPFYVRQEVLQFTTADHQRSQLDAAHELGMRVIRMHACHRSVPVDECVPLVSKALDKIHDAGMLAIVVLNDSLGQYYVHGDDHFHQEVLGHVNKTDYFVNEGYTENHLPFVKRIVAALKDHPGIFAWELGNEYAIQPQPASVDESEAFLRYAETVSGVIRSLDAKHLITTGLVNTGHVAPTGHDRMAYARRLYGLPTINFGTVHFYQGNGEEENSHPDLDALKAVDKPLIVEEFGPAEFEGDKAGVVNAAVDSWLASGAAGFMQWALSDTPFDVGIGDGHHGMDPYAPNNKPHYETMKQVYKGWTERL